MTRNGDLPLDPEPWVMRNFDGPGPAPRSSHPDFPDRPEWFDRENSADYWPREGYRQSEMQMWIESTSREV